jgi:hypothetical protein
MTERCGFCGSENRTIRFIVTLDGPIAGLCRSPWHDSQPSPELARLKELEMENERLRKALEEK